MAELRRITDIDDADPNCDVCKGEGWVCENHEDVPWEASGHSDNCGAGAPCICNPLYSAGHTKH